MKGLALLFGMAGLAFPALGGCSSHDAGGNTAQAASNHAGAANALAMPDDAPAASNRNEAGADAKPGANPDKIRNGSARSVRLVTPEEVAGSAPPREAENAWDLPPTGKDDAVHPFPREVANFMVERDGCDHFRGEEPYDQERRAFLEQNIRDLCTGTDARLAALRKRYASNPDVATALAGYEDRIETTVVGQ